MKKQPQIKIRRADADDRWELYQSVHVILFLDSNGSAADELNSTADDLLQNDLGPKE